MESFIFVALLVLALVFGLPIAAIVSVSGLRGRVDALAREVRDLQSRLAAAPPQAPAVEPSPEPIAPEAGAFMDEESLDEEPEAPAEPPAEVEPPRIVLAMGGEPDAAPAAPAAPRPEGAMERAVGTKWTVWIGGVALALGGIFLVRYSIEQGLLGPGVRIFLGALFAVALAAAGEYLRRNEVALAVGQIPSAHIPGVLTAVAILSGFATVYAAYALYEFLPPPAAFVLLAACSVAALYLSWLHGPGLAGLGLVGSYATPALVATEAPSAWALFVYLLVGTAAADFVARLKGWPWLAVAAAAGAVLWGWLWCGSAWSEGDIVPFAVYVLGLMGLGYHFLPQARDEAAMAEPGEPPLLAELDRPAAGILVAVSLLALPAVRLERYDTPSLLLLGAVTAALLAGAWRWRGLSVLVPWAAVLFGLVYLTWHFPALIEAPVGPLDAFLGVAPIAPPGLWEFLMAGLVFGGAFAAAGLLMSLRPDSHRFWTLTAAAAPLVLFAYAYPRATGFEHHVPFGGAALALAAGYVAASDLMHRQGPDRPWPWRSGCYAASAVVALALAMTIVLEKGWLTIGLALICPGLAWVAARRPVPGLRYLAAGMAAVVMLRLAYDPLIVGGELGRTPIFNWLLYGYGVPAVAFVAAAWTFRAARDDWPVRVLEAAGILCAVALFGLQIRHALNDGDVRSATFDLAELSVHSIALLGLALGLQRVYDRLGRVTAEWAAAILGTLGLTAILLGHLVGKNPLLTGESIGDGRVFNLLLLAYPVPALLCGLLFLAIRGRRHELFVLASGVAALLLLFAYVTLEVRALFHGPVLTEGPTTDAERYAYSAAWLLFGAALLAAGIGARQAALRHASLAILVLTVCKVFLFDMANLSGILRALSFIGLGLVLVAIGYFYQRFVFPPPAAAERGPPVP